ncbi:hypothetical protein [Hymenobacter sp. BT491]|uniref:hypothetical protein n=1 Tax=Hymenobacter sp. BT491 TaxID=2766779 RepID=UPI001653A735|nr:hypothetical protein [Hymenobacter sp. BT491]MBC6989697.1 hypothetical protein [Hymenobacter sp. BT491]
MLKDNRHLVLIYLLIGAIVLSVGLNCYLLSPLTNNLSETSLLSDDATESEAELQLTRSMLAHCQAEQMRKDSLLVKVFNHIEPLTTRAQY